MRNCLIVLAFLMAGCSTSSHVTGGQVYVGSDECNADGLWNKKNRTVWIDDELMQGKNNLRIQQVIEHELGHALMGGAHTQTGLMSPTGSGWDVPPKMLAKIDPDVQIEVLCTSDPVLRSNVLRAIAAWNKRLNRTVFR